MSLYSDILRDVQSEIIGLNLVPNVYRRKEPRFGQGLDSAPAILVTPEAEQVESLHSENTACLYYPVVITFVQSGDGNLEQNVDDLLDWREEVRQHFHKQNPLPNVAAVFDGEIDLNMPFERGLIPINYDVSQIRLFFLSDEAREA